LISIGACATSGGIQALRNWQDVGAMVRAVYPTPGYVSTLKSSTPVSDHVPVDFELRGCPISKTQLLEVLCATLAGRRPNIPTHSVCLECKRRGNVCVLVAGGEACLGPVTQTGCGAICPAYGRGCYGCFGPMETPNVAALSTRLHLLGHSHEEIVRLLRGFNAWAWPFRSGGDEAEKAAAAEKATAAEAAGAPGGSPP
jgi:coenzyme F420-reducing hydrogenase gamma subunit